MDRFLAGDGDLLLDCSSDLPMLPLPLLLLPVSSVLPPESVMAHSPVEISVDAQLGRYRYFRENPGESE